jgi:hypothetical protein
VPGVAAFHPQGEFVMGKYVLGWVMGVPVILLVVIYLIFN